VTQSLYSLTLFAEVQRRAADSANLEQVIDYSVRLGQVAQQALKEMRLLVYELRTAALETEGLVGAVQQRLDAVEKRAGVEARLVVEAMVDLPAVVEEGLYRIAQEALNNALKHAAATSVTVRINADNEQAVLEISDNGRGFAPNEVNTGGMGLSTMRERAERLGGQFTITATPGKGTRVSVTIPARRSWSRPLIPIDIFSEVSQ
jgi:signal transduction histidine kinase